MIFSLLQLHLAALTSLKGEIIEINNRLHRVISERDGLEKQLNKSQVRMSFTIKSTVKPAYEVTSIKQSPVLKGHIFLVLS